MPLIGLEPKPGDLIAFIGIEDPYDHWGVYVGDDYVVHIQARKSLDEICKIDKHIIFRDRAKVEFGKLEKVAGERYYLVNNTNDIFMTPYDAEEIVRRAKSLVGKKFGYSMIGKNCEHFVNYVRYEEEFSKQAENAIKCLLTKPLWELEDCICSEWEKNCQKIQSNQATPANPEPPSFIESLAHGISNAINGIYNRITNLLHF
ncbi:phospholipase A and acyltransferase 3-like isoform X1 [Aquarana catesbeiana]|uniref:phospholipase A and acyltransferase 3-like isoform X1 n=1 Tax=Aquarana catesbeiana TaxID=8400 RepID=UPI003CCA3A89